jgi:hypothetical protein
MEARMCFEFKHGLADISKFYPSPPARNKIQILIPMLKLKTHSGFHDLFLNYLYKFAMDKFEILSMRNSRVCFTSEKCNVPGPLAL